MWDIGLDWIGIEKVYKQKNIKSELWLRVSTVPILTSLF